MTDAKYRGGGGFRDLSDFNLVLLRKPCWRLLTWEETYLADFSKHVIFQGVVSCMLNWVFHLVTPGEA